MTTPIVVLKSKDSAYLPCNRCKGTSQALYVYADGSAVCLTCEWNRRKEGR